MFSKLDMLEYRLDEDIKNNELLIEKRLDALEYLIRLDEKLKIFNKQKREKNNEVQFHSDEM